MESNNTSLTFGTWRFESRRQGPGPPRKRILEVAVDVEESLRQIGV
jgi:hypothetical protein